MSRHYIRAFQRRGLFASLVLAIVLSAQANAAIAQELPRGFYNDVEVQETYLVSTLSFVAKPQPGGTVTATYTIKAVKDGLRDIVIHLEAGRFYTPDKTGFGTIRYDLKLVGESSKQMKTVSLSSLKKGDTYRTSFTVKIPNVDPKSLAKLFPFPDRPIVAAWTTFKRADGENGLDSKIGRLSSAIDRDEPSLKYGNYFASLYLDTDEKPCEANAYLHFFGPTDGPHGEDIDWIRNLEKVRKALDLPDNTEGRTPCVGLWDYVVEATKQGKESQEVVLSQMANEVNVIASKEKVSKPDAARKFLYLHVPALTGEKKSK